MKAKQTSMKRLTFQGIINTQQQRLPQKSRSKSKTRSKATSISKSNVNMTNRSQTDGFKTNKVEPRSTQKIQDQLQSNRSSTNQSIFRTNKKNFEQELMKKIIKIKNNSTQLQSKIKLLSNSNIQAPQIENKQNVNDLKKMEQIQIFLEEFDIEIRKQARQIGEQYMKKIEDFQTQIQRKNLEIPQYKPISISHCLPQMPNLQSKLKQIQSSWFQT